MNVARAKLDLIKPEEVNMDEYEVRNARVWINLKLHFAAFFSGIVAFPSTDVASGLQELPGNDHLHGDRFGALSAG